MGEKLYMSKQEVKVFLDKIPSLKLRKITHDQVRVMFLVLLTGAMRISEVLQLTPNDLLGNGKVRLRQTKGGWQRCKCSEWKFRPLRLVSSDKTCPDCIGEGKYRISQDAWVQDYVYDELKLLSLQFKPDERIFPISRRQALNYANELMRVRTHTFRHTWLTWMLESEKMNIRDMKQKARHKNVQTTIDYIEKNTDYTRKKEDQIMGEFL